MIPNQRHLFDMPDDIAYLNCAYMSPLMHKVQDAGNRAIAQKGRPWTITPVDFFTTSERARGLFARLIGAAADDIAIIPSVSYGITLAAANLPLAAGSHVLCLEEQFPSNIYPWLRRAEAEGAELRLIRRADAQREGHTDWTGALLDAIDERTAIVAVPNCHWTDGALIDVEALGRKARAHGAALVLDITQSGGVLPIDVAAVRPDFLICATYKWLLGPYAMGFAYAAPQWQQGRPVEEGWITRAGSENFARLVDYQDDYQPGARRFDMGERSNFQLMPMVETALAQIHEWGVANIQTTLAGITAEIESRTAPLGLTAPPTHLRAGHYLGLSFGGPPPENLLAELAAEHIYASIRGDSMRVTPHLYNNAHDIDRLISALERTLGR